MACGYHGRFEAGPPSSPRLCLALPRPGNAAKETLLPASTPTLRPLTPSLGAFSTLALPQLLALDFAEELAHSAHVDIRINNAPRLWTRRPKRSGRTVDAFELQSGATNVPRPTSP